MAAMYPLMVVARIEMHLNVNLQSKTFEYQCNFFVEDVNIVGKIFALQVIMLYKT